MSNLISREQAQKLLEEHVKDEWQLLHAKMVATAMEFYAKQFKEDPGLWYITGLLHDVDYGEYPDEHPKKSIEWFKEMNMPQDLIHAIEAHAYIRTNVKPQTRIAKVLVAIDELSGFLYAYYLMRKTFGGMKASKVKKKLKDKKFAAKISRDDVNYGLQLIKEEGIDPNQHIAKLVSIYEKMIG